MDLQERIENSEIRMNTKAPDYQDSVLAGLDYSGTGVANATGVAGVANANGTGLGSPVAASDEQASDELGDARDLYEEMVELKRQHYENEKPEQEDVSNATGVAGVANASGTGVGSPVAALERELYDDVLVGVERGGTGVIEDGDPGVTYQDGHKVSPSGIVKTGGIRCEGASEHWWWPVFDEMYRREQEKDDEAMPGVENNPEERKSYQGITAGM